MLLHRRFYDEIVPRKFSLLILAFFSALVAPGMLRCYQCSSVLLCPNSISIRKLAVQSSSAYGAHSVLVLPKSLVLYLCHKKSTKVANRGNERALISLYIFPDSCSCYHLPNKGLVMVRLSKTPSVPPIMLKRVLFTDVQRGRGTKPTNSMEPLLLVLFFP